MNELQNVRVYRPKENQDLFIVDFNFQMNSADDSPVNFWNTYMQVLDGGQPGSGPIRTVWFLLQNAKPGKMLMGQKHAGVSSREKLMMITQVL